MYLNFMEYTIFDEGHILQVIQTQNYYTVILKFN